MKETMLELNDDHTYTTEDERMSITVDFSDPEEREATIWYDTTDEDEKQEIRKEHEDFIDEVMDLYNVSILDSSVEDTVEVEDGLQDLLSFDSEDEDETLYNGDGEEIEDPDDDR